MLLDESLQTVVRLIEIIIHLNALGPMAVIVFGGERILGGTHPQHIISLVGTVLHAELLSQMLPYADLFHDVETLARAVLKAWLHWCEVVS